MPEISVLRRHRPSVLRRHSTPCGTRVQKRPHSPLLTTIFVGACLHIACTRLCASDPCCGTQILLRSRLTDPTQVPVHTSFGICAPGAPHSRRFGRSYRSQTTKGTGSIEDLQARRRARRRARRMVRLRISPVACALPPMVALASDPVRPTPCALLHRTPPVSSPAPQGALPTRSSLRLLPSLRRSQGPST